VAEHLDELHATREVLSIHIYKYDIYVYMYIYVYIYIYRGRIAPAAVTNNLDGLYADGREANGLYLYR